MHVATKCYHKKYDWPALAGPRCPFVTSYLPTSHISKYPAIQESSYEGSNIKISKYSKKYAKSKVWNNLKYAKIKRMQKIKSIKEECKIKTMHRSKVMKNSKV